MRHCTSRRRIYLQGSTQKTQKILYLITYILCTPISLSIMYSVFVCAIPCDLHVEEGLLTDPFRPACSKGNNPRDNNENTFT